MFRPFETAVAELLFFICPFGAEQAWAQTMKTKPDPSPKQSGPTHRYLRQQKSWVF
jgi:hypothetical protein